MGEQLRETVGDHRRVGLPSIVDAVGAAAYLVDERGFLLAANAQAEDLLSWSSDVLVSRDVHEVLHRSRYGAPLPVSVCPLREPLLGAYAAHGEGVWLQCGDGSLLPVAWSSLPFKIETGRTGALVTFWRRGDPETDGAVPRQLISSMTNLERLALLAETTTQLSSTLDVGETLDSLVALVTPRLADWAVVDLITENNEIWRRAVVHAEDGALVHRQDLQGPMPLVTEDSQMPLSRALRGAAASVTGPETYQGAPDSGIAVEQRRLFETTGMHSAIIAPIRSHRRTLGP